MLVLVLRLLSGGDRMEELWWHSIRVRTLGALSMPLATAALQLLPLFRTKHTAVYRHHFGLALERHTWLHADLAGQLSPNIRCLAPILGPEGSLHVASCQMGGWRQFVQADFPSKAHLTGRF